MNSLTFHLQPIHLEDDLVRLIPLKESDFERLYMVASDPLIWEQHPTSDRYKRDVFRLFFDGAVKSGSSFLVFDQKTQALIGSTRFYDYAPEKSSIAVGYSFLARNYWGGLYNKAVKKLLIDYAMQFVDVVVFHIGATNLRSQKAVLKIGATKTGEVDFDYYGQKLLHYEYCIRKQDWIVQETR